MVKNFKSNTAAFSIQPETEKEQMALEIFHFIKKKKAFSVDEIINSTKLSVDFISNYLDFFVKKEILEGAPNSGKLSVKDTGDKILGIGCREETAYLASIDTRGKIIAQEKLHIDLLTKKNKKNKDISGIVEEISFKTRFKSEKFEFVGLAVPEDILAISEKAVDVLASGVSGIFSSRVFHTKSATASGYGDREYNPNASEDSVLFMYSDIGIGVIFKKESIFEADEYNEGRQGAYLRPWNQFSMVATTKDLVSRGVGTEIVEMVKGDIDRINMDVVLRASEKGDELAVDLVKRSASALGVRVAYLINMFGIECVLLGGGIERVEGGFIDCMRESLKRFVSKDISERIRIVPGVLGKEAASVGAAVLCRREMFMEV
ncbi:MAG: ROK family protein [Candidatus Omnitrophica bacterium]|nr:ROK family protein [Candidatus Omnitrophota bacterium]